MENYPKTIANGVGEKLIFVALELRDNVEYLVVQNEVSPGAGPPMHVHHLQNEEIKVLQGLIGVEIEGEPIAYYEAGERILFKSGVMHRFWNAGNDMLKCEGEVWPAHNIQYFLTEIFQSAQSTKTGMPSKLDAAFLLTRYKSEFDMKEIPLPVKKIIFPILLILGKLTGRYTKYKNAPLPYS